MAVSNYRTLFCVLVACASSAVGATDYGRTAGSFGVSRTGAATYEVPIWTPPGPNGVQPSIALTYSSQSGNGLAGVGWSLAAVSSIERCPRTIAQDGSAADISLTSADRFCLGGSRLRLSTGTYGLSGSVYFTEIADYSRITAYGTAGAVPDRFVVEAKSGLKYEYGNGTNARVLLGGTVLRWMLNKVYDRDNNSYAIAYLSATGFAVPDVISWTPTVQGGSTYSYDAKFNYSNSRANDDSYLGNIAGNAVANRYRLESIQIKSAGVVKRKYRLGYDTSPNTSRSRLISVKECADDAETNCFLPLTFSYQAGQGGVTLGASSAPAGSSTNLIKGRYDLNGDGKDDVVYWGGTVWNALLSTNSGFAGPYSTGISSANVLVDQFLPIGRDAIATVVSGNLWTYRWDSATSSFVGFNTGIASAMPAVSLDFTGDGLADLVYFTAGQNSLTVRYNTSTGSGNPSFGNAFPTATLTGNKIYGGVFNFGYNGMGLPRADINGDRRQDLNVLIVYVGPGGGANSATILLGSSGGLDVPPEIQWIPNGAPVLPVLNFNGDRCADRLVSGTIQISTCSGVSASSIPVPANPIMLMDWNGDGKTDLLVDNGGTFGVYKSTGASFSSLISTSIPSCSTCFAIDQDGDGLDDFIKVNGTSAFNYWIHTAGGSTPTFATNIPDLLSLVTDGFGVTTSPSYVSTAWSNYDRGATTSYPLVELDGGKVVVSQVSNSDGNGGTFTKQYYYVGARGNATRGEFAGFQRFDETDNRNSLIDRTYLEQWFPITGLVSQHELMQPNGTTTISRSVYTNSFTLLDNTGGNERYFLYTPASTSTQYEVGGTWNAALLRTVSTANSFENITGTLYRQIVTTTEPASGANGSLAGGTWTFDTLAYPVTTDTTNWCLGRPQVVQQTNGSNLTFGAFITRTRNITWDAAKCRPTQLVDETGSSSLQVTTDLTYDSFGNVSASTATGVGMEPRSSSAIYSDSTHTTGQFPLSMTQSVSSTFSQTSTFVWNYDLGVPNSAADPNGLTTSWAYDAFGRRIRETQPDQTYTTFDFSQSTHSDSRTRIAVDINSRDPSGTAFGRQVRYFDQFDRTIYEYDLRADGYFNVVSRNFDSLGRVIKEYFPYHELSGPGSFATASFDLLNRLTAISRPISDSNPTLQSTNVSYEGLTTRTSDAQGKNSYQVLNAAGQLARSKDHDGNFQGFDYDAFGNLKRIFDTAGNVLQSSTYDIRGGLTQRVDMDMGTWNFTPNALGETVSQTDAKGQTTTFAFDRLGRLTSRSESEGTSTWTWGVSSGAKNIGRLSRVAGPGYSEDYTYDPVGRPLNTHVTADTTYDIDFDYNSLGALNTLTYPTSTSSYRLKLQYGYQNGHLASIKDFNSLSTVFWTANSANARDQITQETLGITPSTPGGIVINHAFDVVTGWLKTIQTGPSGSSGVQNLAYMWDLLGNLASRKDINQSNLTETFFYDNLYRLDYSQLNGVTNLDVAYDGLGNITSKSDVGAYTYHATKKHQLSSTSNGWSFAYDNNGNMTSGRGESVDWTSYNYPSCIRTGSSCTGTGTDYSEFRYTPNRQYWKQVANYSGTGTATTIYVGGLLEKVTTSAGTDFRHLINVGGSAIVVSRQSSGTNSVYYTSSDHIGSSSSIMNSAGGVLANASFDVFGKRRGSNWSGSPSGGDWTTFASTTRHGFTGHSMLDNLNMTHMNGRVYDQVIGRFVSADPFVTDPLNTQNYNRYSYVYNNPLSATDPSGFADEHHDPYRHWYEWWEYTENTGPHGSKCDGPSALCSRPGIFTDCLSYACNYLNAQLTLGSTIGQTMADLHRNDGDVWMSPLGPKTPAPGAPTTMPGDATPKDSTTAWSGGATAQSNSDTVCQANGVPGVPSCTYMSRKDSDSIARQHGALAVVAGSVLLARIGLGFPIGAASTALALDLEAMSDGLPPGGGVLSREASVAARGRRTAEQAGISAGDALRIQNAATRTGQDIIVIGSRARGTAGPLSDWDYIMTGASRARSSASGSVPRGLGGGAIGPSGRETGIDIFQNYNSRAPNYVELDPNLPHVIFSPK